LNADDHATRVTGCCGTGSIGGTTGQKSALDDTIYGHGKNTRRGENSGIGLTAREELQRGDRCSRC